ncbi:MAG: PQQ-dependent sugar dehydrogenase, partial [Verrucomicrobiae bacterium]|nr:PQQ-dependent sugar dehydrogenase [Verrucomicrobiae bacterium]
LVEADAVLVTTATERPSDLDFDADGNGYVLDENGIVFRIKQTGSRDTVPWLILTNEHSERSVPFRSIALHPGFLDQDSRGYGRFYTIEPEKAGSGHPDFLPEYGSDHEHHQDALVEYQTLEPGARTFTGSRKVLARFSQPGADHNVNDLVFDRIGRLFVAVGDGGSTEQPGRDAPSRNAMSLMNAYGKVLRIDPLGNNSANGRYGVPPRNPFLVIDQALPEIWCYGLRDPRRIEFDPYRDWLSIVDLGQDGIEELNISENGGEHFGWDLCEGSYFYPPARGRKPTEGVVGPRVEFAAESGMRAAGGFIYRGNQFPALRGRMLFSGSDGRLMTSRIDGQGQIDRLLVGNQNSLAANAITAIRPGPTGELFVLTRNGDIFELQKRTTSARSKKSRRPILCWAL